MFWEDSSSCKCKKVVSDILGEIKFVVNIENTCKITHFESWYKSQFKIFTFLWTKQDVKKTMKYKGNLSQGNLYSHAAIVNIRKNKAITGTY